MIDIAFLRERKEELAASLARRGSDFDLDALEDLDARRRSTRFEAEELRAKQKNAGKSISKLSGDEKTQAIAVAGKLAEDYKRLLAEADDLDALFSETWIQLPNLTDPSAADGLEEDDAVELYRIGSAPEFNFKPRDHVELGTDLDIVDIERATKISGSRFGLIKGKLAIVEFALVRYAMDNLMTHGFTPVIPPVLVREHALVGLSINDKALRSASGGTIGNNL